MPVSRKIAKPRSRKKNRVNSTANSSKPSSANARTSSATNDAESPSAEASIAPAYQIPISKEFETPLYVPSYIFGNNELPLLSKPAEANPLVQNDSNSGTKVQPQEGDAIETIAKKPEADSQLQAYQRDGDTLAQLLRETFEEIPEAAWAYAVAMQSDRRPPPSGRAWPSEIRLVTEFPGRRRALEQIVDELMSIQDEPQLHRFMYDGRLCPWGSGWIQPLLPQFEVLRGKRVVLFLLDCPEKNCYVNVIEPDVASLTSMLVGVIAKYLAKQGVLCMSIDLRKECRRDPLDRHCAEFTPSELEVCALVTMGEIGAAANVYQIQIAATVAVSPGACDCLRRMATHSSAALLGECHYIDWHPNRLTPVLLKFNHRVARGLAEDLVLDYVAVIGPILEQFGESFKSIEHFWDHFWKSCAICPNPILYRLFIPFVDVTKMDLPPRKTFAEILEASKSGNAAELQAVLEEDDVALRIRERVIPVQRMYWRTTLQLEKLIEEDREEWPGYRRSCRVHLL